MADANTSVHLNKFTDDLTEGLESFAERLEKYIDVEHYFVDGGLVIGLNASFGSGKTTFLNMWRNRLVTRKNDNPDAPIVIDFNAWESDYYGDPLFALVSRIVEVLEPQSHSSAEVVDSNETAVQRVENGEDKSEKIKNAAKDIGWGVVVAAGQFAKKHTGIDAEAIGKSVEQKQQKRKSKSAKKVEEPTPQFDSFTAFQQRRDAMRHLQKVLKEVFGGETPQVLVLVDELDRCRPDYAIHYLETIKHIFDIKGMVFLLAADRHQLEVSARQAFGNDMIFNEYYRKFVQREVPLPELTEKGYEKIAQTYVNKYIKVAGVRHCFMKLEHARIKDFETLCGGLKLQFRQIQEAFRIAGHVLACEEGNNGRLYWAIGSGTVLMTILKVGKPDFYVGMALQKLSYKELGDFLKTFYRKDIASWWFTLCFTGGAFPKNQGALPDYKDILAEAGFEQKADEISVINDTSGFYHGWGDRFGQTRIKQIYDKIENLESWGG